MLLRRKRDRTAKRATLVAVCGLLWLLAPANRTEAKNELVHEHAAASPTVISEFAIADFDGDRKPDLATVEIEPSLAQGDRLYSIRFKLTSGEAQVFGVIAPAGGLQIVARDVNGDNALDVLVRTAWQHKEVAVLLNDGHGNFTLADPGAFPASIWEHESQWNSESMPLCDCAALLHAQNSPDGEGQESRMECTPQAGLAGKAAFRTSSRLLLFSLLGRAPPASILRS